MGGKPLIPIKGAGSRPFSFFQIIIVSALIGREIVLVSKGFYARFMTFSPIPSVCLSVHRDTSLFKQTESHCKRVRSLERCRHTVHCTTDIFAEILIASSFPIVMGRGWRFFPPTVAVFLSFSFFKESF